jgi:hypothetical protein
MVEIVGLVERQPFLVIADGVIHLLGDEAQKSSRCRSTQNGSESVMPTLPPPSRQWRAAAVKAAFPSGLS